MWTLFNAKKRIRRRCNAFVKLSHNVNPTSLIRKVLIYVTNIEDFNDIMEKPKAGELFFLQGMEKPKAGELNNHKFDIFECSE